MSRDRRNDPPKSAAELMAELQRDPKFVARQKRQEDDRAANVAAYHAAARELLDELGSIGFKVDTIGDLRKTGKQYEAAVPVLVKWLPRAQLTSVKEDIVRTLSVPWAKSARTALFAEFEKATNDDSLRWAIANALEVLADDDVFEHIADLAKGQHFGRSREMIVLALAKMMDARTTEVLTGLLSDDVVAGHALQALATRGSIVAASLVMPFLQHPQPWVREEAKKLLASIPSKH